MVWSYLPVITSSSLIFSLSDFVPHRAHFLEGVFTAEKLKKYGPELPTLNPQTRWQINTTSGVRLSYIRNVPSSNLTAEGLLFPVGSLGGTLVPSNADIFPKLYPD